MMKIFIKAYLKLTNINLILSSTNTSHKHNVKVKIDTWGSDHFPISIEIDVEKFVYNERCFKIKSVRTKCELVEIELNNYSSLFLTDTYNLPSPIDKYRLFTNIIIDSIKNNTPIRKNVKNKIYKNPVS